jgi:tetratricopeptide (TPR) repeat protein
MENPDQRLSAVCGEGYLLTGRAEEAHRIAQRVLTEARHHKERGQEARVLWLLGEIAMHRDPPDVAQAATHYPQALTLAEALGMRPLQAHCHHGLGTLYATMRRREQAHAALSSAIELFRALAMAFWLPEAEAVLAQVARGPQP